LRAVNGLRTRNFVTRRVLDDYERLFKRARVLERSAEGVASCGGDVRRTHQVYRASASRWCKCRTLTTIGVDGVRTVERERARRTMDALRTRGERGFGGGGSCGRWRMTSTALG
jgi:hypothetical protein